MYLNQILGDNHMNQTINQLERERKEKIRNLNPEETEVYIYNLNKKYYKALKDKRYDLTDFYNKKMTEAVNILKQKYSNIPLVVSTSRITYLHSDLVCERIETEIGRYDSVSQIIIGHLSDLYHIRHHLEGILHIYYFHCFNHIGCSVTDAIHSDLWEKLDEDTFMKVTNNQDFYKEDFYHKMLLKSFDRLIGEIRDDLLGIINECDNFLFLDTILPERIEDAKENFESEKDYIYKNVKDKSIKILKDRGYLDLLLRDIEAMSYCHHFVEVYKDVKSNILELIDGDSFELLKEIDYKIRKEDSEKSEYRQCPTKKDFMKGKPSYNIRNLKLIIPSFYSRLGDDDE